MFGKMCLYRPLRRDRGATPEGRRPVTLAMPPAPERKCPGQHTRLRVPIVVRPPGLEPGTCGLRVEKGQFRLVPRWARSWQFLGSSAGVVSADSGPSPQVPVSLDTSWTITGARWGLSERPSVSHRVTGCAPVCHPCGCGYGCLVEDHSSGYTIESGVNLSS